MSKRGVGIRAIAQLCGVLLLAGACGGTGGSGAGSSPAPHPAAKPSPIDGLFFNGHSVLKIALGKWTLQSEVLHLAGAVAEVPPHLEHALVAVAAQLVLEGGVEVEREAEHVHGDVGLADEAVLHLLRGEGDALT